MRLFIALVPPRELRQKIAEACQPLAAVSSGAAWCEPKKLHITLAFLGKTSAAFLPHLTKHLSAAASQLNPFQCRIENFGYFGSRRRPSVIWVGAEPYAELTQTQEALWKSLNNLGFAKPDEDYTPHITVARCKKGSDNRAVLEIIKEGGHTTFGSWCADRLTLFESRPTPRGVLYRPLHVAHFRDSGESGGFG